MIAEAMGEHKSPSSSEPYRITGENAVGDAADAVRRFAIVEGIGGDDVARLAIVIEELIANLYDHGGVAMDDLVELKLSCANRIVTATITDPRLAFDPRSVEPAQVSPDRDGGVGLGLVHAWADIVDYRSNDGRNRLDLRLILTQ